MKDALLITLRQFAMEVSRRDYLVLTMHRRKTSKTAHGSVQSLQG